MLLFISKKSNWCVQNFGNFSSVGHFLTPPPVDTADMGHAEADGANEWEDDHNARLYNAPGTDSVKTTVIQSVKQPIHDWYMG